MKWPYTVTVIGMLLLTQPATAFYNWQAEQSHGDARLLLRGFGLASRKPDNPALYQERNEEALGGLARVIVESRHGQNLAFEFNAYQTYMSESLVNSQSGLAASLDVERSGALEWSLRDDKYAHLAIDRLNARWSTGRLDLSVGRQAINLATTFFFSPNDFFAPFSAQAFYRVYKPGVDAVRSELSFSELSTLSMMVVQGYQSQPGADSGWSDAPDSSRNSYLARYVTNLAGFEWALLAGKVRRSRVHGGSISGELFDWLGIRAEGHQVQELDDNQARYSKYTIGLEHRWENSLMLQLEQYYHGPGATDIAAYDFTQAYPARRYLALGLSYEFTPLLTGQFSLLHNQVDQSRLYTLYATYSLSNESELALSLSIPNGPAPEALKIKSEFGSYPKVLLMELRAYF